MKSYESWLAEGAELAILRMLGLFDRPAAQQAFDVLLKSPAIAGLTESLTDLRSTEWQTILAKLRRARLLAREDPHNPGQLDTHPLVREYFANSSELKKRRPGRNVIGGSITTIRRWRRSCRTISGRWNPFSQLSYAAAMPVCIVKRFMKFIFREFSGATPPLRLIFLPPGLRWFPF